MWVSPTSSPRTAWSVPAEHLRICTIRTKLRFPVFLIRRRRADWCSIRSRVSRINYFGATYQYQRLLSYPAPGTNETQTHALLLFYTLYPTKRFSISVFGGPQYADVGPQFSDTVATPSDAGIPKLEPVGRRQPGLAGTPEQPGHQLRASDIEWRRVDRGGENGQRQRIDAATTSADAECDGGGRVC